MKKQLFNKEVYRIKDMMKKIINESYEKEDNIDSIDGVPVDTEMDDVKFIKYMELFDSLETKYENELSDKNFLEKYDILDKMCDEWADSHNAYVHEFWSDDEGSGSAFASAYGDALEIAKKENKNLVVLKYNS